MIPTNDKTGLPFVEEELKHELGDKYEELGDMVHQLKENLKRVAKQSKMAD